jgi:hypothetical protein
MILQVLAVYIIHIECLYAFSFQKFIVEKMQTKLGKIVNFWERNLGRNLSPKWALKNHYIHVYVNLLQ